MSVCDLASQPISPVSSGWDEIEAAVDPGVWNHLLPANTDLLVQVLVKLVVHVLQDRSPAEREERSTV